MPPVKELREKTVPIVKEIRRMADLGRDFSPEEQAAWEKSNGDYNTLKRQIDITERAEALESSLTAVVNDNGAGRDDSDPGTRCRQVAHDDGEAKPGDRALAFAGWCRTQMEDTPSDEQVAAAQRLGFNLGCRKLDIRLADTNELRRMQQAIRSATPGQEMRALESISLTAGGATVAEGFVPRLERTMLAFGGVAQVAEILRTDQGGDLPWPSVSDTSNKGRRIAQNAAVTSTGKDPTFSRFVLHAYDYTSDAVLVPYRLLQDSAFDLAGLLGDMLGERLGRILNDEFTTGTGDSQPRGIVTGSTLGVTTAAATAITRDELVQLIHSVDPAYRTNCRWMLHDNTLLTLKLLKDGEGRSYFPELDVPGASSLLGYPFTLNQSMASSVAASAKTILFGDLSYYKIREVQGIRMYRLVERYRDNDEDGFVAFMERDGGVLDAGGHPIRHMLQHA